MDSISRASGSIFTMTSLISSVHVVSAVMHCLEQRGPKPYFIRHRMTVCWWTVSMNAWYDARLATAGSTSE